MKKRFVRRASSKEGTPKNIQKKNIIQFVVIGAVALGGYTLGVYNQQIWGAVAPLLGYKVYTAEVDLSSVETTFRTLKAYYDGDLDDQTLIEGANRGMTEAVGDQYTVYMNAKEAQEFEDDLSGNIGGGVGAEVALRSERTTIIRVLDGNPAQKAGLKAGDVILEVNDESTEGKTVEQVVAKIRGEVDTTVKLKVLRGDEEKTFSVTRATITNPSAYYSIEDGVGILTLNRFDSDTNQLSREAARAFKAANVRGVVVDVRYNGGGYLDAAKNIAGIWLKDKVVVSERTNGVTTATLRSGNDTILEGVPTVVLVNGASASASEILAGALQDNGAAKIVGETTFGKGSVQQLISLPDGAQLKVTIARWYTPNGKNITEEGITPDVQVGTSQDDLDAGKDPQLDRAIKELDA